VSIWVSGEGSGPGLSAADIYAATQSLNTQTDTDYTLVAGDAGRMVILDSATPVTVTVPAEVDVSLPTGTRVDLFQYGAGQVFITGDSGVTVVGTPSLQLRAQFSCATLVKIDSDSWLLAGDMES